MKTDTLTIWLKLIRTFTVSVKLIEELHTHYPDLVGLNDCNFSQLMNLGLTQKSFKSTYCLIY